MRQRVRAVIIEEDKVLFIHRIRCEKEYWVLPGGGVEEEDADLETALRRECMEELGVEVEIGELFTKTYFELEGEKQEQYIFRCLIKGGKLGTGNGPEYQEDGGYEGSFEVEWLHRDELLRRHILPGEIKDILAEGNGG